MIKLKLFPIKQLKDYVDAVSHNCVGLTAEGRRIAFLIGKDRYMLKAWNKRIDILVDEIEVHKIDIKTCTKFTFPDVHDDTGYRVIDAIGFDFVIVVMKNDDAYLCDASVEDGIMSIIDIGKDI